MINRETIWRDTYSLDALRMDNNRVEVFTAIHHYTSGNSDHLDLCSEMRVNIDHGGIEMRMTTNLTADQMEELAGYLLAASGRSRKLQSMLDDEEAEIAAAAKAARDSAKESA